MTTVPEASLRAAAIHDGKAHLLLAASGSTASMKLPLIIAALQHHANLSICVILTKSAGHLFTGQSSEQPTVAALASLPNVDAVHQDEDEWVEPWTRGVKILHIELRRWAQPLVVVPMTANLRAKVTGGLCDNLLTNIIRAWDIVSSATIIVAPSMNDRMFTHLLTAKQIAILEEWEWFEVLPTQVTLLACGDIGQGGMCEWKEIIHVIEKRLALKEVA